MLSKSLENAINDQVTFEFYSSYTYLAMAAYCESIDLSGFANFFRVQAKEEIDHAMKFYDYVFQKGGTIVLGEIDKPKDTYKDVVEVFETGLAHEDNILMQSLLKKNGFEYCGIVYLEDGGKRVAFEKTF